MKALLGLFLGIVCFTNAWSNQLIDTSYAVEIGGIKQWINIKGQDTSEPLLLWLHGGPGVSEMSYSNKFSNLLQKHFIVVQWDQRESGKTAGLNHSPDLSLTRINQDVYDIINYLLQRYHKERLLLVGNSWGGYLALHAAKYYPELIEACILVSPMIYGNESEQLSLQYVTDEAKKRNNKTAMMEIDSIKVPFEQPMDTWLLRKWMFTFHGENISRALPPEKVFLDIVTKWFPVVKEFEAFNPFAEIKKIDCPIFFLLGRKDYITHTEIAQKFYDQLQAQTKQIYWFDAGHMITLERSRQMQQIIIDQIAPALITK
jgi:pimeloyl-ACP methyl ester carboxylesterase